MGVGRAPLVRELCSDWWLREPFPCAQRDAVLGGGATDAREEEEVSSNAWGRPVP